MTHSSSPSPRNCAARVARPARCRVRRRLPGTHPRLGSPTVRAPAAQAREMRREFSALRLRRMARAAFGDRLRVPAEPPDAPSELASSPARDTTSAEAVLDGRLNVCDRLVALVALTPSAEVHSCGPRGGGVIPCVADQGTDEAVEGGPSLGVGVRQGWMFGSDPCLVECETLLEVVAMVGEGGESGRVVVGTASDAVGVLGPGDEGLDCLGVAITATIRSFAHSGKGSRRDCTEDCGDRHADGWPQCASGGSEDCGDDNHQATCSSGVRMGWGRPSGRSPWGTSSTGQDPFRRQYSSNQR